MSNSLGEITEALGTGLFPSRPGRKPTFWKDGRNVNFEFGVAKSALGQYTMFTPEQAGIVTGIQASVIGGVPTVFYATTSKLWRWDESNGLEDISKSGGYAGASTDLWSFGRWGSHIVASNGTDAVQYYQNTGDAADLSGVPFTYAKVIYTTDQYMLAFNTSLGGNWLGWSDLDDITDWTAVAANDAGSKFMRNIDSDIVAVKKLGDSIIAYTFNEMFEVAYIGRPFIFGTQFLLEGFGPVGKKAVAAVGRRHFGFGRRGIWVTDGVSFDFIQSPAVFDFVYKDADTRYDKTKGDLVIAWHDQLQNQVVFYYPKESGSGYNDIGIAFNYDNNTWTIYDYGRSAVDDSGVFPFAITGDRLGNIYQQGITEAVVTTGDTGVVELTTETALVETGLGVGGLGEGGIGGGNGPI